MSVVLRARGLLGRGVQALSNPRLCFAVILLLSISLSLVFLRSVLLISPFQISDINVPYLSLTQTQLYWLSAWNYQGFGEPTGFNYWLLGTGLLSGITHSPAIVEEVTYYSALPVASVGAYLFLFRIGVSRIRSIPAALLFQLCPWFIGLFMDGQPVFIWLYALLPFLLWGLLETTEDVRSLRGYATIAVVLAVSSGFSLEALPVFGLLSVPFVARSFALRGLKSAAVVTGGWLFAALAALGANVYALGPYASLATSTLSTSGTSIFSSFSSSFVEEYKIWLLLLLAPCALVLIVVRDSIPRHDAILLEVGLLVTIGLDVLFFSIPSVPAEWLYRNVPLLLPFLDADKFLLVAWFTAFVSFAIYWRTLPEFFRRAPTNPSEEAVSTKGKLLKRPIATRKQAIQISTLLATIIILLSATLLVHWDVSGQDLSGQDYVSGQAPFAHSTIPGYYLSLRNFLLSQGASFGASFHTLVVPQNPGNIIPAYIGSDMIPGFLGPSATLLNVTTGLVANDSRYLQLMSYMGIRFVAVIPSVQAPWWPNLADSPPSLGEFGPQGWFPQGNSSDYVRELSSWANLQVVYNLNNVVVFENKLYVGTGVAYSNQSIFEEMAEGNFGALINRTPTGPSVILNPDLTGGGSPWKVPSGPLAALQPNGTIEILNGSLGTSVDQEITLETNTTYQLTFHVTTAPGFSFYPTGGRSPTYAGVYWDTTHSTFENPSGAHIFPPILGAVNNSLSYLFTTPIFPNDTAPSALYLYAEGPVNRSVIYTTFSAISLVPVNGSSMFRELVEGTTIQSQAATQLTVNLSGPVSSEKFVTLPFAYNPAWQARTSNGTLLPSSAGPLNELTFEMPKGTSGFSVTYSDQEHYTTLVELSTVVLISIFVIVAWSFSKRLLRTKSLRINA